jgi:hypothetical protein
VTIYLLNTNPTCSATFTLSVSPSTKLLASDSYKAKIASMINFPILHKENNKTFKIKKGTGALFKFSVYKI